MMAMNVRYSNYNQKNDGDELFLCKRCGCIHQLGDRICDKDDTGRHWFTCPVCGAHDRYAVPLIDFIASAYLRTLGSEPAVPDTALVLS